MPDQDRPVMIDLLEDIHRALDTRAYILALLGALTLPDICSAMDHDDGVADGARYVAWFDRWIAPRYDGFLDGRQCYRFRCALLHQATTYHPKNEYKRLLFLEPKSGRTYHRNIIGDALNLDLEQFVRDCTGGVYAWHSAVKGTEIYRKHATRFIRLHPQGIAPYIKGLPVIG